MRDVVKVISSDASLSTKLLRIVNSPSLGIRREVRSVPHAVAMVGLKSLRALSLSFTLGSSLANGQSDWFRRYWKRSALAGLSARRLAVALRFADVEEAFLAGLMQDIGMLALCQIDAKGYRALIAQEGTDHDALIAAELAQFGADHAEVGAWLARKWRLPEGLALVIGSSHAPRSALSELGPEVAQLARIVAVAGPLADIWLDANHAAATLKARALALEVLGLTQEQFDATVSGVRESMGEVFALLDVPVDATADLDAILEEAREAVLVSTVSQEIDMQKLMNTLEQRAQRAEELSVVDPLTGVANGHGFAQFMAKQMPRSRAAEMPISFVAIDVDHFKQINDTRGHQTGDIVLQGLGELFRSALRPRDLVVRQGGEEFLLVLPDTPLQGAVIVAERMRARIEELQLRGSDGAPVRVTASLGCATYGPFDRWGYDTVLRSADEALYTAKREGRNRVRIAEPSDDAIRARLRSVG